MIYEQLTNEEKIEKLQAAAYRSLQQVELNQQQIQQYNAEIDRLSKIPSPKQAVEPAADGDEVAEPVVE